MGDNETVVGVATCRPYHAFITMYNYKNIRSHNGLNQTSRNLHRGLSMALGI